MLPVISTPTIAGSSARDGRDYVGVDSPVSIRVLCQSSGSDVQKVTLEVLWGDDQETSREWLIGVEETISHTFSEPGIYSISVQAVNSLGQRSLKRSVTVWVEKIPDRQRKLVRWRGLALPTKGITVSSVTQRVGFSTREFNLATSVVEGVTEVFVTGRVSGLVGSEFTISQPGRLYTAGRVIEASENKLVLDTATSSDYTRAATIEITQRSLINGVSQSPDRLTPWFFPVSTDEDLIKGSLTVCFSTMKGEMLHLPSFGSNLQRSVFEQADDTTMGLLEIDIADAAKWEPRASLADVTPTIDGHALKINAKIRYSGDSRNSVFNASIPLDLQ